MFKATYGYRDIETFWGILPFPQYKVVDFIRNIEVFKIGSEIGPDKNSYGEIYCLKNDDAYIPFGIRRSVESDIYLRSLDTRSYMKPEAKIHLDTEAKIPLINVEIIKFGDDLNSILMDPRAQFIYPNYWSECDYHGYKFTSQSEKNQAFTYLQEALPILFFDDYSSLCDSRPAIIVKVIPFDEQKIDVINNTGAIEATAINLNPKYDEKESPDDFLTRLERKSEVAALTIEEFMSEILIIERGMLFYGNGFVSVIRDDQRFWEILEQSYNAYYEDRYENFYRFLYAITQTINTRIDARRVYEKFGHVYY